MLETREGDSGSWLYLLILLLLVFDELLLMIKWCAFHRCVNFFVPDVPFVYLAQEWIRGLGRIHSHTRSYQAEVVCNCTKSKAPFGVIMIKVRGMEMEALFMWGLVLGIVLSSSYTGLVLAPVEHLLYCVLCLLFVPDVCCLDLALPPILSTWWKSTQVWSTPKMHLWSSSLLFAQVVVFFH